MTRLSSKQILEEKQAGDYSAISILSLTHKALSDISCLADFKNLERLDLSCNNLTSLQALKFCVNLKWLSVLQNKLQSLEGIEDLSKLTVLNAGKNKLRSIEEVKSLVSLRALILNDNEIGSICKLDRMKDLNTIVLSRNPVHEIGDSLVKLKSITKLSLSNCQIQSIDSSLKFCIELKELRLAHNDIKTLPAELAYNTRLQNLDLGNNLITSWSDLKVICSLVNLKNLNLQGSPIAEKEKLAKKIRKLLPNLQIFNARPTDKIMKYEKSDKVDLQHNVAADIEVKKKDKRDHRREEKNKHNMMSESNKIAHLASGGLDMEKELKKGKRKANDEAKKEIPIHKEDHSVVNKELNKKAKKVEQGELSAIDDAETPFMELFAVDTGNLSKYSVEDLTDELIRKKDRKDEVFQDSNSLGGSVELGAGKKKTKSRGINPSIQLSSLRPEVGLGGPSTWDDE